MKQVKLVSKLIAAGMLSIAIGTVVAQVAQAQRSVFLLDNTCVNTRQGSYGLYGSQSRDISVGRELYTSVMYMSPRAAFTCRLPGGSASLLLQYGISDTDAGSAPIAIAVYLDGSQVASRTASPGQTGTLPVDVSGGRSLALETICVRASNCSARVWFFKAQIEPGAISPGRRN